MSLALKKPKMTLAEMNERILKLPPEKKGMAAFHANKAKSAVMLQPQNFEPYKYRPAEYISTFLKWMAWTGMDEEHPGQFQILEACALVMRQQEEKDLWEKGELSEDNLTVWAPQGPKKIIKNWIRVESGNGIGKTKSASGILNWFLDCFVPSAIFTLAPGGEQARLVLWSEIRADREGKGLPGKILEKEIKITAKHFAVHRTASTGGGKGEERLKGKHEAYQLFVLDEADGIDEFIFDSISSMTSGGQNLVVMFANPKSRSTMFHRCRTLSYVRTFRVSTLYHPNVRAGKEDIPNAVKRDFVEKKLEKDCDTIHLHDPEECSCSPACKCSKPESGHDCGGNHKKLHDPDDFTFELPYDVVVAGVPCPAGTIFKPNARFMTDILGITPPTSTDKTVIPTGRFDDACKRKPQGIGDPTKARVGVDAARWGSDLGTMYLRYQDKVEKIGEIPYGDSYDYMHVIVAPLLKLKDKGVTSLHLRIDAGLGGGVVDVLRRNNELIKAFKDYKVFEVSFNGEAKNRDYYNIITEMYYEAAETLKTVCIANPAEKLEADLCERQYDWRNVSGIDKKILEPKEDFRKRKKHSPDDGDGCVLALAPDFLFNSNQLYAPRAIGKSSTWRPS